MTRLAFQGAAAVVFMLLPACARAKPQAPQPQATACPERAGLPAGTADHGAALARKGGNLILAGDFFFAPTCLSGVPGQEVELRLRNTGKALHNFTLQDQGIHQDLEPGKEVAVTVRIAGQALGFFCQYHKSAGMRGALLPAGVPSQ